jgi:AcrR family transcriptional regulator
MARRHTGTPATRPIRAAPTAELSSGTSIGAVPDPAGPPLPDPIDTDRPAAAQASDSGAVEAQVRRGRRRDPTIDTRVANSVIEIYAQFGWAGLTFDEVARRAKVGKAALYLRWASKEDLLLDSMASVHVRRMPHHRHDLRTDLAAIGHSLLAFYSSPRGLAYLRMYVESRYVPGLEDRWRKQHTTPIFRRARSLIHEAVARGELPEGTSPTIVLDALIGAITNHVLSTPPELFSQMQANGPAYVESLIDFVLAGARASGRAVPD